MVPVTHPFRKEREKDGAPSYIPGPSHTLYFLEKGGPPANFSHDDLGRVNTANCGSVWNQSFSFDPFGNITKSGSISWGCPLCYNTSTNRYNSMISGSISYDNNGNLTNDTFHTYSWDADGRMVTVDATPVTYDAFGRMAEVNNSSQFLYLAGGEKPFADMSGATLGLSFAPLPGGGFAVYTSSGILNYSHSDWLGSARLLTTPSRTLYVDEAYAPYGEPYAASGSWVQFTSNGNQWTANGVDDFMYRHYHSVQGRWISPDPAALAAVNLADPQTWNRYSYVENKPCNSIDPFGLDTCTLQLSVTDQLGNLPFPAIGLQNYLNSILGPGGVQVAVNSGTTPDYTLHDVPHCLLQLLLKIALEL